MSYDVVIPGVIGRVEVRSPTLPPATHTNAWVLGAERVTVVDPASPWPEEQEALASALAPLSVERILLTHHHVDHVSGAEDLRARTGAPIVAHPITADLVDFEVDEFLEEGPPLDCDGTSWTVLHTPGHAPGHLCLHDPASATIVAGDMVAGVGTIVLVPPEGDLGHYLAQLGRLRDLSPARLCAAHGPVITDAVAYLQHYLDHRNMRTEQVRSGLRAASSAVSPRDLVPGIYPELPELFWGIAAAQVHCHLLWLEGRGEVRSLGPSHEVWELT